MLCSGIPVDVNIKDIEVQFAEKEGKISKLNDQVTKLTEERDQLANKVKTLVKELISINGGGYICQKV